VFKLFRLVTMEKGDYMANTAIQECRGDSREKINEQLGQIPSREKLKEFLDSMQAAGCGSDSVAQGVLSILAEKIRKIEIDPTEEDIPSVDGFVIATLYGTLPYIALKDGKANLLEAKETIQLHMEEVLYFINGGIEEFPPGIMNLDQLRKTILLLLLKNTIMSTFKTYMIQCFQEVFYFDSGAAKKRIQLGEGIFGDEKMRRKFLDTL
jgi:hypothetical protein